MSVSFGNREYCLNRRQRDVLYLMSKGLRNAEIGQQLRLSERTVKWYVSQLFLIFDVTNRTELVGAVAMQDSMQKGDQMKQPILSSSVLLVLACCGAYGQLIEFNHGPAKAVDKACTVDDPRFRPSTQMQMQMQGRCLAVKEYMRYKSPISPIGDGTLAMMGDEAAFHLYTIMITRPPLTTEQTLTVLDIIHNSFKMPVFIQSHADRKPEKSLVLLKMLQATAVDQIVKERIATETTFLNTLPEKITPVPILNLPSKPGALPMREDFPTP